MNWRTETVRQLCEAMRQTDDYSALPILADALEDGGYSDEKMLEQMRGRLDAVEAQKLVALVYSDETAEAVRKIEELADDLGPRAFCEEGDGYGLEVPTDYGRLMRVGERWANDPEGWGGYTVEHGSDDLRDSGWDGLDSFWEAFAVITGKSASGNPFSCTC